jgi:hypothetical protein
MERSLDQFEEAFERAQQVDEQRRLELRRRAANRSRARDLPDRDRRRRHGRDVRDARLARRRLSRQIV